MMDGSVKRAETRESKEQKDEFKHIDDAMSIQPPKKFSHSTPAHTKKKLFICFQISIYIIRKINILTTIWINSYIICLQ